MHSISPINTCTIVGPNYGIPNIHAIIGGKAKAFLAEELLQYPSSITVISVDSMQKVEAGWMGWPRPLDPTQPMWKITLQVDGQEYICLADVRGEHIERA